MKQENCTTNEKNNQINLSDNKEKIKPCKTYHHLNFIQRQILENKLKHYGEIDDYGQKITYRYIAYILNVNVSTIAREVKRNKYSHLDSRKGITIEEYDSTYAQAKAEESIKKSTHKTDTKLNSNSVELINLRNIIKNEKISVEYAMKVYEDALNKKFPVCQKTVYKYVHHGIMKISKKYFKYLKSSKPQKPSKSGKRVQKGDNIALRPAEAKTRKVFGHWEGDTVYGQKIKSKECSLTIAERKTRTYITLKLKDRTNESVGEAFKEIEERIGLENFRKIFKTITFDNGAEFSNIEAIENSAFVEGEKRVKIYFANPYHSWERGTNENTNGMLRYYYPKGTNFEDVSASNLSNSTNKINSCPRKILNGLSSFEAMKLENPEFEDILKMLGIFYPFQNVKKYLIC